TGNPTARAGSSSPTPRATSSASCAANRTAFQPPSNPERTASLFSVSPERGAESFIGTRRTGRLHAPSPGAPPLDRKSEDPGMPSGFPAQPITRSGGSDSAFHAREPAVSGLPDRNR